MAYPRRKKYVPIVIVALCILAAYVLRFLTPPRALWAFLRACIYLTLETLWGISVHRRIIYPRIRRLFTAMTALMMFWMVMRTVKFMVPDQSIGRCCWYLYYVAIVFIPLSTTLIAAHLGKPEGFRLPRRTWLLYLAAAAITLLVLTNDLHQWVFVFPPGKPFSDTDYRYGAGFAFPAVWHVAGLLSTLGLIFVNSRLPGRGRRLLAPIFPMGLLLLYHTLYITGAAWLMVPFGDMTVVQSLLIISLLECCLRTGLIQSNTRYEALFRASGISAVILDESYTLRIASETYQPLPTETLRAAEDGAVMLPGHVRLSSFPIRGGRVLWQEDVSEVFALLAELRDVNKRLSEDNDLLAAEEEMCRRQARVAEKDRLYDAMTREMLPLLQTMDTLLAEESGDSSRETLKTLCVRGTYIKRRCNLLLLREDVADCDARELEYCLRESCEALRAIGVDCAFRREISGALPLSTVIALYDLFHQLVEAMLPELSSLFLYLSVRDGTVEWRLLADHAPALPEKLLSPPALCVPGSVWRVMREDGATSVSLRLEKGGVDQ